MRLGSIFVELEKKIVTFVKDELKEIQKVLSSDYPDEEEEESVSGNKDEKQSSSSSREAFLKITVDFLRMMNLDDLADLLQSKSLITCQQTLKSNMKERFQCVFEGIAKSGNQTFLNQIYTELYITEGGSGEVNNEHEVRQIESVTWKPDRPETAIRHEDIFKSSAERDEPIRTVMTKGVAGIGKTVLTQKFTLDWAEDQTNQDIQFMFRVFTQIFREERGLYQNKVFCFVHLSVQEFLAALHVHLTFIKSGVNLLEMKSKDSEKRNHESSETDIYQSAVDMALESPDGHLDLFLRFLLGLSLEINKLHLRGLVTQTEEGLATNKETAQYIKEKMNNDLCIEKSINLFHCLNELNDQSLVEEIQQSLQTGSLSAQQLSPAQWSALHFILLSSEKDLETFDLKKYSASEEALLKLVPIVKASSKAVLSGCNLSERSCEALSSLLSSTTSSLRDLDLSNNDLRDSGVKLLCSGLMSPDCELEILRLSGCLVTEEGCAALASALTLNPHHLKELDLSFNYPGVAGMESLKYMLKNPKIQIKMDSLRLSGCNLSERSCEALSSLLSSTTSSLRDLDLSNNDLKDSGVKLLCSGLMSPNCKLEILRLSGCLITEEGCAALASALTVKPHHLKELDLSYNNPGEAGMERLAAMLKNSGIQIKTDSLSMDSAAEKWLTPGLRKYSCPLTVDLNTVNRLLKLSDGNRKVTLVGEEQPYPDHPDRFDLCQLLCTDGLTGRCYWEVEWSGKVYASLSYRGINRKGDNDDSWFGLNDQSWSLICSDDGYTVWHNHRKAFIPLSSVSGRVAVYVDCPAGTLSFYRVSSETLIHLYTFNTNFTETLYPGFGFEYRTGSWVSILQKDKILPSTLV
ncbi:NACHT, LRR and PYD domains-containing protein 3-like [Poecilia formosa]|uniref:NACHT, LRR and PYD domains-containing protein 3-like n=1 Tax=Poecilia formosa TaxID=48698 RepID=UPI0007B79291|nr:PREDICTED: NACHT, LRR and PYD domains-containing protein 3-like [Poecilia formosa]